MLKLAALLILCAFTETNIHTNYKIRNYLFTTDNCWFSWSELYIHNTQLYDLMPEHDDKPAIFINARIFV